LSSISWNGTALSFTRSGPGLNQVYSGTASGRFLSGTFTHNGGAPVAWSGARAEVLGFGLGSRLSQRASWQDRTRSAIVNLTEGMRLTGVGVPAVTVTTEACVGCPFTSGALPAERDDNPNAWPANYSLQRLRFSVQPGSRFDPAHPPPARVFFGYLATPTTAAPPGGYRVVVAVNGHGGDAQQLLTKNNIFWHGESAARRNLVVLAVDIGHRPEWNSGPIVHSAIIGSGYTSSDWEEEGERAFSVRRAIDYLATVPNVRLDRIFLQGLSMGGEVTTITAGLDPRIVMAMPAGYSPDMHVMDFNGNHPCYLWNRADIHEYVDISDYEALTAPRLLVVQTGLQDFVFSPLATPWAADKQVTRRARAAYGPDAANLVHYLHYDTHAFHVGDFNPTNPSRPQGIRAAAVIAPSVAGDLSWQTDSTTTLRSPSLYHLMNENLL
jgi:dienelactone hydrolase